MHKRKNLAASLTCIVALAAPVAHAADLKLGALYPFSGGLALLGDESFRGLQLAVNERNAAGGVNGNKIVLVKADAVDANQAVGEARRLTSVENVAAVFGSYASGVSAAATQVTAKLSVNNLLDTVYYDAFYRSNSPFVFIAPGRSVWMTISGKL